MTTDNTRPAPDPLRRAAARSLAMHVLIAKKVTANPALLQIASANLERWGANHNPAPRWISEWREILKKPWPEISALITSSNQESDRLRKSTPFVGILSPDERRKIFDSFKASKATEAEWLAANATGIAAHNEDVEAHGVFSTAMPRPAEDS
jgi:hypothetical protein